MPFFDSTETIPVFYNVVNPAGKNCPNRSLDVKLVQTLLLKYYTKTGLPAPGGKMTVDGFAGSLTLRWILQFQLDLAIARHQHGSRSEDRSRAEHQIAEAQ